MSTRHTANIPTRQYHRGMAREKIYPSESLERFIVRFPDGMRDRIADAAKANNRSMNSEIIARLLASFEPQEHAPMVLRIDLTVSEETRVKEIQAAIEALSPHRAGLPLDVRLVSPG